MKKIHIGLFGFGCVGQGLYKILQDKADPAYEIKKIVIKNPDKDRIAPSHLFTTSAKEVLDDQEIDVIIELIDDADSAFDIVKTSISKSIPVISANKKMIAHHLTELIALQKENNTPFLYEGAVCGSIPILQTLNDYYNHEKIVTLRGIFNGSSNYILSKVFNEGISYQEALKQAQDLGFAEADPTLDVEGFDPKFKLGILIKHAFGFALAPERITNWGINKLTKAQFQLARELGLKIKLVAEVKRDNKLQALIAPTLVSPADDLYHVENELNAISIQGEYSGNHLLRGNGAGSLPTGLSVYADLLKIRNRYTYRYEENTLNLSAEDINVLLFYDSSREVKNKFHTIKEHFIGTEYNYIIGQLNQSDIGDLLSIADVTILSLTEQSLDALLYKNIYKHAV